MSRDSNPWPLDKETHVQCHCTAHQFMYWSIHQFNFTRTRSRFFVNIGENSKFSKFCYRSSKYLNFIGFFCLYRRKMTIRTCSVSFSFIVCRYFSKWRLKMSKKSEKGCNHPLTLWLWRLTLPPSKMVPPIFFFYQNDRKGCKRGYLHALDHFL